MSRGQPEGKVVFRDGGLVITASRDGHGAGAYVAGEASMPSAQQWQFSPSDGLPPVDFSRATPEMTQRAHEMAEARLMQNEYTQDQLDAGERAADASTYYMQAMVQLLNASAPAVVARPAAVGSTPGPAAAPAISELALGIPDLYSEPQRPEQLVSFDLPGFGRQRARYHWALVEGRLLVLVFDSRYDGVEPFIPPVPTTDKSYKLTLHAVDNGADEIYEVLPTGLTIPFGCFSMFLLIIESQSDTPPQFAGFDVS